jgi:ATP-binding cassette subfamily B (MDR/TAP) protein 1
MARGDLMAFSFLVVYLAVIQGSLAAGQWLSFGPSMISNAQFREAY